METGESASDRGERTSFEALERGTRVESSDGQEVGTVKRVMIVREKHLFDGVVISTAQGDRFVDAPEVGEIYERVMLLKINAAEAAKLPKPGENPAAMRVSPDDVAGRGGGPVRRIWNRISGR